MKHARADYQHIQDPHHKIPMNEPVFLIRGQDIAGPDTIGRWAELVNTAGADNDIIEAALKQADAMERWQNEHGVKVPNL